MPISSYLKGIRSRIGHDLLVIPAVSVSIMDDRGRLLLGKDSERHVWVLPGGAIDPYEVPADAAVRECFEETGFPVELKGLIGVFGGPEFLVQYPNGDIAYSIVTAFRAAVTGGARGPGDGELSQVQYFDHSECESLNLSPAATLLVRATFAHSAGPIYQPANLHPSSL